MPENVRPHAIPERQRIVAAIANITARWSVIATAALLPFFIVPIPWILVEQSKVSTLALLTLIALVSWVIARISEGSVSLPKNVLLGAAAILPIAYATSALVSGVGTSSFVNGSAEQDTVVGVCMFFLLLTITAFTISRKESAFSRMLQAFLLGSGILALFQAARFFAPESLTMGGVLQSTTTLVGSVHDLGILLGLLVLLALALYRTPLSTGFWKWLISGIGVLAYLMLFPVNETDVWYALGTTVLILGGYRWYISFRREHLSLGASLAHNALWIAGLVVIIISLAASSLINSHLPVAMRSAHSEVRPSWQGTLAIGEKVLSGKSGFIFGSGPNTFAEAWGRYKPLSVNSTQFWNIDFMSGVGLVPTAFATLGILGIIAWAVLVCGLLWSAWRFFSDRNSLAPPGRAYTGAALFASLYLASFLIMYVPGTAIVALAFLFFGFLASLEVARDRRGSTIVLGWRGWALLHTIIFLSITILFALSCVTALRATSSNMLLGAASAASASGDSSGASVLVQRAIAMFPSNDGAERAAVQLGLMRLSALVAAGGTDESAKTELQATLSVIIQHGLAAVSINSSDYQNWLALANVYKQLAGVGVEGASTSAKQAYDRAITENPTNPLLLTQLAQLEISQNDLPAAMDALNKALELKKDFPAAYFFRSQVEVAQKDFTAAKADATAVTDLTSTDPLSWYNLGSVYYAAGEYDSAIAPLTQAISLQNNYADALFMLGLTYGKLDRMAEGLPYLQQVASLNPANTIVTSALKSFQHALDIATSTPMTP